MRQETKFKIFAYLAMFAMVAIVSCINGLIALSIKALQ